MPARSSRLWTSVKPRGSSWRTASAWSQPCSSSSQPPGAGGRGRPHDAAEVVQPVGARHQRGKGLVAQAGR
jgi:hypothetical protein